MKIPVLALVLFGAVAIAACHSSEVSDEHAAWRTARSPVKQLPASEPVVAYLLEKAEAGDLNAMADISVHYAAAGDELKYEYWLRRQIAEGGELALSELAGYLAAKGGVHCAEASTLLNDAIIRCSDTERCEMLRAELADLKFSCIDNPARR